MIKRIIKKKVPFIFGILKVIYHKCIWLRSFFYEVFNSIRVISGYKKGVADIKRTPPLIISFTTMPSRMSKIHLCIETLLRQTLKPDRIVLWITEETQLTSKLKGQMKRGLEIRRCEDLRSYKKFFFSLKEFPDALIVTADDDIFYPRNWLRDLYVAYKKDPGVIHCHRAHNIRFAENDIAPYADWDYCSPGYNDKSLKVFPTSGGGVLYFPGSLNHEVLNKKVFMEICLTADDIWLKAMSLMDNIKCRKVRPKSFTLIEINGTQGEHLAITNLVEGANDPQIKNVFSKYKLYEKLLN
ncbi:MAG: glycosyltransferase family 2 protein [Deltaproteobacteria bacterium]|nr:glycosyltransferase family 2 protein [Deltaproteobacteria bacterium]